MATKKKSEKATGITNQPRKREKREQQDVPPRGERKDGSATDGQAED